MAKYQITYGNNTFRYKRTTDNKEFDVIIPDGSYDVKDLNNYLRYVMKDNGDNPDDKGEYPIRLYANHIYQRVTVVTKNNYILNYQKMDLVKYLGLQKQLKR